ncbi:hypothetical protein KBB12_00775 [Candidatus Woesebacteria bacterium]|nr:hypothetical protein [Candidatus Woesebacteria bacterium]
MIVEIPCDRGECVRQAFLKAGQFALFQRRQIERLIISDGPAHPQFGRMVAELGQLTQAERTALKTALQQGRPCDGGGMCGAVFRYRSTTP